MHPNFGDISIHEGRAFNSNQKQYLKGEKETLTIECIQSAEHGVNGYSYKIGAYSLTQEQAKAWLASGYVGTIQRHGVRFPKLFTVEMAVAICGMLPNETTIQFVQDESDYDGEAEHVRLDIPNGPTIKIFR